MGILLENIKEIKPLIHSTHRHIWIKFLAVFFIFFAYFVFVSVKYGVSQGFLVSWVTWSFFVLCTPIADAGFLIDFPLRLFLKIRMIISEVFVWGLAISLNVATLVVYPEVYSKTSILKLFRHILENPWLLLSIVILSATGTFLSIKFGDELVDVINHKDRLFKQKHNKKHNLLLAVFVFAIILVLYDFLLKNIGIDIKELI